MAKGNTGNFLQHFVALNAMKALAASAPAGRFEYVDLFAMEPWEALSNPEPGFTGLFDSLPTRESDPVASVFLAAQRARGAEPANREYPSTLVLALTAGLDLASITACEIDEEKRENLETYLAAHSKGIPYTLHGDFAHASLTKCNGAAFVIMDPLQVDIVAKPRKLNGYMSIPQIRGALGSTRLDVLGRIKRTASEPCITTIFSYGEPTANAEETHRALSRELGDKWGWSIDRVVEPTELRVGRKRPALHQAWWCASHPSVAAPKNLQESWEAWARYRAAK
jgi:hypothetical protein